MLSLFWQQQNHGKLPATILSRCQRFDFRQISEENIIKRLKIICDESKIKITSRAVSLIATLSEGAMRDGISILERCVQDGIEEITEEDIRELAGIPEVIYLNGIMKAISVYNVEDAINTIKEVLNQGKDINNFLWEIIKYIKDILVYKTTGSLNIYNEEETKDIKELSNIMSKERLMSLIYQLSELENTLKWSTQKQLMFEAGIIKACVQKSEPGEQRSQGVEELENRIIKLEEELINIKTSGVPIKIEDKPKSEPTPKELLVVKKEIEARKTKSEFSEKEFKNWNKILESLKKSGKMVIYTNLINTTAKELNDITLGIEFKTNLTDFGKRVLEQVENRKEIEKLVSIECGKEMNVKFLTKEEAKNVKKQSISVEEVAKDLDLDINIIDE